jgi:uncharacterized membrane protein
VDPDGTGDQRCQLPDFALNRLSITLGAVYFGYGFAVAILLTLLVGLMLVQRLFRRLEEQTFMLQG